MANAKNTKSKKPATKTKAKTVESVEIVEEVAEEIVEDVVEEAVKEPVKKAKRVFNDDDLIPCLCVFPGTLGMTGKRTQRTYLWEDMGVLEYVEYQDLRSEVLNKKSSYVYNPLFIIQDEDFLNANPNLKRMYEDIYTPDEIIAKIRKSSPEELKKFIKSLPNGIRSNMANIAATMIKDGALDSIKKIKVLDDAFGTDLNMYSQFFADEE